jgi:hypothetical protein
MGELIFIPRLFSTKPDSAEKNKTIWERFALGVRNVELQVLIETKKAELNYLILDLPSVFSSICLCSHPAANHTVKKTISVDVKTL